jgi:HlyD family secretion protein
VRRFWWLGVAIAAVAGALVWRARRSPAPADGIIAANGRMEAREIDLAAKVPGRVEAVLVAEGDTVAAGQVVAQLDTQAIRAALREADAKLNRAQASRRFASATLAQREAECSLATRNLKRSEQLFARRVVPEQQVDRDRTAVETARSGCVAAEAQVRDAGAAIAAVRAERDRLRTQLDDATIRSPGAGMVLFRLAEPGEVLPVGGRVLTIVDPGDIYMTIFLPARDAARIQVGTEARLLLDGRKGPVPAVVSFIASEAQFTPKSVETAEEREKLVFRVKVRARANADRSLRPGMPGVAYLRPAGAGDWPPRLQ